MLKIKIKSESHRKNEMEKVAKISNKKAAGKMIDFIKK